MVTTFGPMRVDPARAGTQTRPRSARHVDLHGARERRADATACLHRLITFGVWKRGIHRPEVTEVGLQMNFRALLHVLRADFEASEGKGDE